MRLSQVERLLGAPAVSDEADATCEISGCGDTSAPLGWMPPRYAWALLGLGTGLHLVGVSLGMAVVLRAPLAGLVAIGVGLWMAIGSKRRFRRLGLALPPDARPNLLLTDGWFGLTRNPMYVGIAMVLMGVGLLLGTPPALLAGPVFLLLVRRWFVPVEEAQLEDVLGEAWRHYARRVPRWL